MAKRAQQESGEGRVTAKSRPMMNLTARMPSVVSSSTSSNPVRTSYGYQDLENLLQVTIDRGNLCNRHNQVIHKRIMVDLGLLKSGKVELRSTMDQGNLRKFHGINCTKVDPHREEPLLGGNAHSARYGELTHDRSGKPETVNHQEQAYSENFVMGSDEAEFVNKVKDQARNRQKRMSNFAESGDEHSIIWGMLMATT